MRLLLLLFGPMALVGSALAAEPPAAPLAWWVELPRAESPIQLQGWPAAPEPSLRALERRATRGDAVQIARLTRGPHPDDLRELASGVTRIRRISRWLGAVSVEASAEQVAVLRSRWGAERVHAVRRFVRTDPSPGPLVPTAVSKGPAAFAYGPSLQQSEQIQVDRLHRLGLSGCGVRILVLDTGFFLSLPVLDPVDVVAERDFIFDDDVTANEAGDVASQHNHGTGVLAVMAGWKPGNLIGPAYGAEFLLAKTEDVATETQIEEDNFVAALEWGEALGADVASASLGYISFDDGSSYPPEAFDGDTAVTTIAVDALAAMGVLPVIAAGNRGNAASTLLTPADADSCVTVGSVDSLGVVSPFSSRGPTFDARIKPDIMARGRLTVWARPDSTFQMANGTSLATPLVAGAVALLMEANPAWTPMALRAALWSTGTQSGSPDNNMGYGVLQAYDALLTNPPQLPFPVLLESPADGAVGVDSGAVFRWTAATDLQTPLHLEYTVQAATDASFGSIVGSWFAGADTTRVIDPLPPGPFHWRVLTEDGDGNIRPSRAWEFSPGDPTGATEIPSAGWVQLGLPTPNPFNPTVTIQLAVSRPAEGRVDVFDLLGRRVRRILEGRIPLGDHNLVWNGLDTTGDAVSSGVYLLRAELTAAGGSATVLVRRLVLLR